MKTRSKISLFLLIALLVSGLLLTGCPGETVEDPGGGEDVVRQVQVTLQPSAIRMTLKQWEDANDDQKTIEVRLSESKSASYQWYSREDDPKNSGKRLSGATSASYKPEISEQGDYYYYVVVTVEEKVITSGNAVIKIIDTSTPAETQFTIGTARVHYVRGVGGTGAFMFREGGNADASPDVDVKYIDMLMGEMGCNILRIMVQDDYENYINNTVQSRNENVFRHDARKNFFAVIQRVNKLNGYVFANPWTAPAKYKTPKQILGKSVLTTTTSNYIDYADWLQGFLEWLNTNKAPIFALGILNEPDWGSSADYEGMGMSNTVHKDWFKAVGHLTTRGDITPGYGGGGPTHHVLVMTADNMGSVAYYDETINDPAANKNFEILGRHWYEGGNPARVTKLAGPANTIWENRPSGYVGHFEAESLEASPQMFAPGSKAGQIKRETWQTEHDFNYWSKSTEIPGSNVQRYWNSAFAAMNDLDWAMRVIHESVFDWWFSQSYSGLVTSYQGTPINGNAQGQDPGSAGATPWGPYEYTPRGRAFAHYARYVNETWSLPIEQTQTKTGMAFNRTSTSFNAGATDPKINAFEDVNGKFISIVMFTPNTSTSGGNISSSFGQGGLIGIEDPTRGSSDVGRVEVVLPSGFTATSASALRSYGWNNANDEAWDDVPKGTPRYWINEPVFLYKTTSGGSAVEVTLPGGNIISIMVKGSWSAAAGREFAVPERVRPYTVN